MFYEEGLSAFNFVRDKLPVSAVLSQIARYSHFAAPPSVAMQCAPIAQCVPDFVADNNLPIPSEKVLPKLWLSNRFITPVHFDEMNNVACVVSGTRRFTLFPPEQISNLYIGPLEYTPAGAPVSMVSLENPDFREPASTAARISPVHSLMHSLLSMRHLPPEQRQACGRIFSYFLFDPQLRSGRSACSCPHSCSLRVPRAGTSPRQEIGR